MFVVVVVVGNESDNGKGIDEGVGGLLCLMSTRGEVSVDLRNVLGLVFGLRAAMRGEYAKGGVAWWLLMLIVIVFVKFAMLILLLVWLFMLMLMFASMLCLFSSLLRSYLLPSCFEARLLPKSSKNLQIETN